MKEIGIDISSQRSKGLEDIPVRQINLLITLCDNAAGNCPTLGKAIEHIHWPLTDPARAVGAEEDVLEVFRRVRDEIRTRVQSLLS